MSASKHACFHASVSVDAMHGLQLCMGTKYANHHKMICWLEGLMADV